MGSEDAQQPVVGVKEQILAKEAACSTPAAIFLFRLWSLGDIIRCAPRTSTAIVLTAVLYRQEITTNRRFQTSNNDPNWTGKLRVDPERVTVQLMDRENKPIG